MFSRSAGIFFVILFSLSACNPTNPPSIKLRYEINQSLEYHEVIDAYEKLADYYKRARMVEMGTTDVGKPLHLFIISGDGDFDPVSLKRKERSIILINNGIHAGEPAGIDASLQYAIDMLEGKDGLDQVLENTVIAIIPVFNIGGLLNQSKYHRMNQDGPDLKGARRNARNLDLNRDFAKMDSRNTRSFASIFHHLDPDIFIDTHTTNGSDHQSVMTLIASMHQKLPTAMGEFFKDVMTPELYRRMNNETPWGMVPYVTMVESGDIRKGIAGFNDHPYYSSGYASLFNSFAFITETLVYKPFPDRVKATYDFIRFLAEFTSANSSQIRQLRQEAKENTKIKKEYVLDWVPDMQRSDDIMFRGYETEQGTGALTNRITTVYNHERPWTDTIPFYDYFTPSVMVDATVAYIIPRAWEDMTQKMMLSGVEVEFIEQDTVMEVEIISIVDYRLSAQSNQGRQLVSGVQVKTRIGARQFYKGDAIIYLNQAANNYIVNMLEPMAPASFFRWGFFNSTLEDGESWWIWAFEDHAGEVLETNNELREAFEQKMADEADFASDPAAQLQYIYDIVAKPEVERGSYLYPVARLK
ncbi:MAG: M14 family zinc carboxypeptidase [Bacteroidales bacterium]